MRSNASLPNSSLGTFRVILAAIVAASHALALSGWSTPWNWSFGKAAELAVLSFFSMSGFLVAQSFYRSANWTDYFLKRALRIYPAYAAVVVLFFLILNLGYFQTLSLRSFGDQFYYIGVNLLFLNFLKPSLAGIFDDNPVPVLNGSLWTIKIEVLFYCLLPPLLNFARKLGIRLVLPLIYLSVCLLLQISHKEIPTSLEVHFIRELLLPLSHFLAGVLYLIFFDLLPKGNFPQVVLLWIVTVPLSVSLTERLPCHPALRGVLSVVAPCLLTISTLTTARLDFQIPKFSLPDFSYSLYLTHFPLTQVLCALGTNHLTPAPYWITVLSCQWIFAYFFWKWVERPLLNLRDRRRQTAFS